MKRELLRELGIEDESIDKIMKVNGDDIEAQKLKTNAAIAERDGLQTQLADVQAKIAAFEGVDLAGLRGQIDDLTKDLTEKEIAHKTELDGIVVRHAIESRLLKENFTSRYAQKAVVEELLSKELQCNGGEIVGLEDALKELRETNADAFKSAEKDNPWLRLPPASGETQSGDKVTPKVI